MGVTDAVVLFLFVLIESRLLQDDSISLLFILSRMTANASGAIRVDSGRTFSMPPRTETIPTGRVLCRSSTKRSPDYTGRNDSAGGITPEKRRSAG
jgi:hypothetical protein